MERCPLCGSELECREGPLSIWCCSPRCGACFRDLNPAGAARVIADADRGEDQPGPAATER